MSVGRIASYVVLAVGIGATLFFGAAIWREWIDPHLAIILTGTTGSIAVLLRWAVLRRHVGRNKIGSAAEAPKKPPRYPWWW